MGHYRSAPGPPTPRSRPSGCPGTLPRKPVKTREAEGAPGRAGTSTERSPPSYVNAPRTLPPRGTGGRGDLRGCEAARLPRPDEAELRQRLFEPKLQHSCFSNAHSRNQKPPLKPEGVSDGRRAGRAGPRPGPRGGCLHSWAVAVSGSLGSGGASLPSFLAEAEGLQHLKRLQTTWFLPNTFLPTPPGSSRLGCAMAGPHQSPWAVAAGSCRKKRVLRGCRGRSLGNPTVVPSGPHVPFPLLTVPFAVMNLFPHV